MAYGIQTTEDVMNPSMGGVPVVRNEFEMKDKARLLEQEIGRQIQTLQNPNRVIDAYKRAGEVYDVSAPKLEGAGAHPFINAVLSGVIGGGLGAAFGKKNEGVYAGIASGMAYGFSASQKAREKWKQETQAHNREIYTNLAKDLVNQAYYDSQTLKNLTDSTYKLQDYGSNVAEDERKLQERTEVGSKFPGLVEGLMGVQRGEKPQLKDFSGNVDTKTVLDIAEKYGIADKNYLTEKEKKRHNTVTEGQGQQRTSAYVSRQDALKAKTGLEMDKIKNPDDYQSTNTKPENMPYYNEAIAEFIDIYSSGDQAKINKARSSFAKRYGIDPVGKIKIIKNPGKSVNDERKF